MPMEERLGFVTTIGSDGSYPKGNFAITKKLMKSMALACVWRR